MREWLGQIADWAATLLLLACLVLGFTRMVEWAGDRIRSEPEESPAQLRCERESYAVYLACFERERPPDAPGAP